MTDKRAIMLPEQTEIREGDVLRLTGTACSPVRRFVDFLGTVATIDATDGTFKMWNDDACPGLSDDERYCGKFWFEAAAIEKVEVVRRDYSWDCQ
jgi:hypothetical protein